MKRAIICIGHGSRSDEGNAEFVRVVEMLRIALPGDLVLPAFLEIEQPRLKAALDDAIARGATDILVMPCLLFQGAHVREDIPAIIEAFAASHREVAVRFGKPIGADPKFVEILLDRIKEIA